MRALNGDNDEPIHSVQLYLSAEEARKLVVALEQLLQDPDSDDHRHVLSLDGLREVSVSLVTDRKMKELKRYTAAEQRMFLDP
jgi:hypothetical protein